MNTLSDTDEGRATPSVWPVYVAAAVVLIVGLVFLRPLGGCASPRGRIAFVSDRDGNDEIYVMNADGTEQMNLTNNSADDVNPAWSPDGSKIAFTSDRDGVLGIYVMYADGSEQIYLSNCSERCRGPVWSPNGTSIVFNKEDRDGKTIVKKMPETEREIIDFLRRDPIRETWLRHGRGSGKKRRKTPTMRSM